MTRHVSYWGRYGLAAFFGLALLVTHVWIRHRVVSVGYALSDTRQLVRTLQEERYALVVEWESVTAPSQLSRLANRRLGLPMPRPDQIVILR